jgi:hypothetical protein
MSAVIQLTQGYSALIDDEWEVYLSKHRWFAVRKGGLVYAACFVYPKGRRRRRVYLHRMILSVELSSDKVVDHRNHDTLDNREANLRICSQKQNSWNSRSRSHKHTSRFRGVGYIGRKRDSLKWRARIKIGGKDRHLGYFQTEHQAAEAYNFAATQLYGEYACLNELDDAPSFQPPC